MIDQKTLSFDFPQEDVLLGSLLPSNPSEMYIDYHTKDGGNIHLKFKTRGAMQSFLNLLADKEIYHEYRALHGTGDSASVTMTLFDDQGTRYCLKDWTITLEVEIGPFMNEYGTSVSGDTTNYLETELLSYLGDLMIKIDEDSILLPASIETNDFILTGNYDYEYTYQKYHYIKDFDYASHGFKLYENGEEIDTYSETPGYHQIFFIKDTLRYQYYYYCED